MADIGLLITLLASQRRPKSDSVKHRSRRLHHGYEGAYISTENAQPELPPQAALYHLATGHYLPQALCLATKLGIADLLNDGPRPAKDRAEAIVMHAPSLNRVMRLLASAGGFEEQENGSFALTVLGACIQDGVAGNARAMLMPVADARMQNAWQELESCVCTGDPVVRKRGLDDPFKDPARSREENTTFDTAMADLMRRTAVAVAAADDCAPLRTVVDAGGGNGALLIGILQAHPHLHGIVFDQPHAAERAQQQIAASGLAARCEAVGGDFSRTCPLAPTRTSSSTSSTIGTTTARSPFARMVVGRKQYAADRGGCLPATH